MLQSTKYYFVVLVVVVVQLHHGWGKQISIDHCWLVTILHGRFMDALSGSSMQLDVPTTQWFPAVGQKKKLDGRRYTTTTPLLLT